LEYNLHLIHITRINNISLHADTSPNTLLKGCIISVNMKHNLAMVVTSDLSKSGQQCQTIIMNHILFTC